MKNCFKDWSQTSIRVGIFEQAGQNLTSAQIVSCDVLVFEKGC